MRLPKRYGQSSVDTCPFCGAQAYSKNRQGVPVCKNHAQTDLPDLKCICGGWLDQRESKFGVFYTCMRCGPVSFRKMMEVNGDKIRAAVRPKETPRQEAYMKTPTKGQSIQDRIREKLRKGEPLTPDELEFL